MYSSSHIFSDCQPWPLRKIWLIRCFDRLPALSDVLACPDPPVTITYLAVFFKGAHLIMFTFWFQQPSVPDIGISDTVSRTAAGLQPDKMGKAGFCDLHKICSFIPDCSNRIATGRLPNLLQRSCIPRAKDLARNFMLLLSI